MRLYGTLGTFLGFSGEVQHRQADALRVRHVLDAAARTIDTCRQKVRGSLARTQTALAHADLAALRAADVFDIASLSRVLQGLRETVRRLRGENSPGTAAVNA